MLKKTFEGFPPNLKLSAIPAPFFTNLLFQIDEIEEMKVTLALLYLIAEKRAQPRFVSLEELISSNLLKNIDQARLNSGLGKAVERGTFLLFLIERSGKSLYFLNAEPERIALDKIRKGELNPGYLEDRALIKNEKNICTLYEENIGQITPLIAEELEEAEKKYPFGWIQEAFKEAVHLNKRNWRYISRILERWSTEGKSGKAGRYSSKEFDPQDYFKGRYGHIVRGQKR